MTNDTVIEGDVLKELIEMAEDHCYEVCHEDRCDGCSRGLAIKKAKELIHE